MENTLIKQIKDTNTVLCVVKGVIKTSQKAEIKLIEKTDCNLQVDLFFITTNMLP
jgi:hypothetical protein